MNRAPQIDAFFDEATNSVSYLVSDSEGGAAAIIDALLDFDAASGDVSTKSADAILVKAAERGVSVDWILETHAHADHLSAASYLRGKTGAKVAIGSGIREVQRVFGALLKADDVRLDGSDFDLLLDDGDRLPLGTLDIEVMATPGHTPACVSYRICDAVFVGDTLFMPDYGTARCDFPGGCAHQLYHSIRRILSLPRETRLFLCHDYKAPGRDEFAFQTTVAAERQGNIHVHDGIGEEEFVAMRRARDATLKVPQLLLPAVQVNMRAGQLPPAEDNGVRYMKIPLDAL
jgi:glyoxylase-like metal-dependent hydrolase (beta-lactamase superfamily II)